MEYIAHRGKTQKALENTLEAFEHAGQDNHFVGIECDIHSTLDGIFIVHHDDSIKQLDNKKIVELNFQEIKNIKLEGKYQIPLLEEFLDICKKYQKVPMIEIKKVADIEHLQQLITMLELYQDIKPVIISFNMNYLKYLRTQTQFDMYFLTTEISDQNMYDCRVNEINFYINKESLNKETIKTLKSKGFKIGVFTVNETEIEKHAKNLEIDFLTTDTL
jgi:glycerophosphoryl diester phosphodiesterase